MNYTNLTELVVSPHNRYLFGDFDPSFKDARFTESIRKFGILCPVVIDENNNILKGHRRVAASAHVGRALVPTVTVSAEQWDKDAQWSLYLQRRPTLYAQCVMNRHLIQTYIALDRDDNSPTGEEWYKLEAELGYCKDVLKQGVALLDEIDTVRAEDTRDARAKAGKLEQTFRDRGIAPALRLIDEDDYEFKNIEPDAGDWDDEETAGAGVPVCRPPASCPRPARWAETIYRALAEIEKLGEGRLPRFQLKKALDIIELLVDEADNA